MSKNKRFTAQALALTAVLLAAEIILSRFLSISTPVVKIGFAFIPIAIAARKLGAPEAMTVAGLGDLLGALLFPIGPYFPGFTFTAILRGLCFALFLHKKTSLPRVAGAVLVGEIVGSLLLNTLWISVLYGSPFMVLLPTRLLQSAILTVAQVLVLWLLFAKSGRLLSPQSSPTHG